MSRDVDIGDGLIEDLRALPEEIVDRTIDHAVVAGHRCGGEDHSITGLNAYLTMILVRNSGQCRRWLSLTTCTENHHLLWVELFGVLNADQHARRYTQVAQFDRHLHIVEHTST